MNPLKYWLARVMGRMDGLNSPEVAREGILRDIRRAKKSIRVVTCTAHMTYWSEDVLAELEDRLAKYPDLTVEFVVGPEMANHILERLDGEGRVTLRRLEKRPPCDCRIVDDRDTYTSNHGGDGTPRRFCWTFGNVKAVRDRRAYYGSLLKEAA